MFWSFCSVKGGVGTSVLATATAAHLSRSTDVLLVDLAGDQPDLVGVEVPGPGVTDWLAADDEVDGSSIRSLTLEVSEHLRLLGAGTGDLTVASPARIVELAQALATLASAVVVDLGVVSDDPFHPTRLVAAASDRTSLVLRACYLNLRRAQRSNLTADDIIEISEGGRALRTVDIEAVLGQEVTVRLPCDPSIARAADAGLLATRTPRLLRRAVRDLVRTPLEEVRAA